MVESWPSWKVTPFQWRTLIFLWIYTKKFLTVLCWVQQARIKPTNNKWKVDQPLQLSSSISWSHSLFLTQLPYIINHSFSAMGLQSWILIFYSPFQKIVLLSAYYCIKDPHPNLSIEVGLAESLMRGKEKRLGSDEQYREKDSYILKDVFNCHLYHWWEQVRNVFRTTLAASNQEVWPVPVSFRQSKQQ